MIPDLSTFVKPKNGAINLASQDMGSTAVKCGRHQMSEIMGEIRGTPKNVIHR